MFSMLDGNDDDDNENWEHGRFLDDNKRKMPRVTRQRDKLKNKSSKASVASTLTGISFVTAT
eukprot:6528394-Ditylum_brightwellii.AAC.1